MIELITNNKLEMTAFSRRLTKNPDDAQDLYQETIVKILSNGHRFERGTNFKAWALTIMRNTFINGYRKKVRQKQALRYTYNERKLDIHDKKKLSKAEQELTYNEIMALINELPKDVRIPFKMKCEGFKYSEIAAIENVPMGTIKSRIFQARKRLKPILKYRLYGS